MALINDVEAVQILITSVSKLFQESYNATPVLADRIATEIASSGRVQVYPFVPGLTGSGMEEWLGPRVVQNLVVQNRTVENKLFEKTVALKRTDFEDDLYDIWAQQAIPKLAQTVKQEPDKLIDAAIQANEKTYDGRAFFDGYHPFDPTVTVSTGAGPNNSQPDTTTEIQSNDFSGIALDQEGFATVRAAMMNLKNPAGLPLGVMPNCLMVPPSLERDARLIANATFSPIVQPGNSSAVGAASNVWQGMVDIVVNPYLPDSGSDSSTWYLLDTSSRGFRPFIWQMRKAAEFTPRVDPALNNVFERDELEFGARLRGNAALSIWFLAARVSQ